MKGTLFYICLTGFAFTFACCSKPVSPVSELVQITIDPDKVENYIDISPMLSDSIDIIPLETTDESLLSNIGRLIFHKGHFYILDGTRRGIFVFDEKGRFVRKIGKQGGGPGEYSRISFFDVMGDSLIISHEGSFKCTIYNLQTGDAVHTITPEISRLDGFVLDKDFYLITNYEKVEQENFNLCKVDPSTGKVVDKFIPFDDKSAKFAHVGGMNYTSRYNKDSVYLIYPYNDTIYQITKEEVVPRYTLYFTKRRLPDDLQPIDNNFHKAAAKGGFLKGLQYMQISKDYIFGMYSGGKRRFHFICVNRHTLEVQVAEAFMVNKLGGLSLTIPYMADGDLISVRSAMSLLDVLKFALSPSSSIEEKYRARLQELQENLTEDSNPVLFRYRFKETD